MAETSKYIKRGDCITIKKTGEKILFGENPKEFVRITKLMRRSIA